MTGVSLWAAASIQELAGNNSSLFSRQLGQYEVCGNTGKDSFWLTIALNKDVRTALRAPT